MKIEIVEKCNRCHSEWRNNEKVEVYLDYSAYEYVVGDCPDCYGVGVTPTELGLEVLKLMEWSKRNDLAQK